MNLTAQIVCRAFIQNREPAKRDVLNNFLPEPLAETIEHLPDCYGDPKQGFETTLEFLNKIHFSWFCPFLRTLSENEIHCFIASLSPAQAEGLKKMLGLSSHLPQLAPLAKKFFQDKLFNHLKEGKEILDVSCLPASPLNFLIELSPESIDLLIDRLGLHDLSIELRFIIETSKLKKIYACLSPDDQTYLKSLLHQKEPVSFKKMGLEQWNGNTADLKTMLQHRGLNRLAKGLYSQNDHLIWHLCHRMDTEKASILTKFCTRLEHPKAHAMLAQQIIEIAEHIQNLKPF